MSHSLSFSASLSSLSASVCLAVYISLSLRSLSLLSLSLLSLSLLSLSLLSLSLLSLSLCRCLCLSFSLCLCLSVSLFLSLHSIRLERFFLQKHLSRWYIRKFLVILNPGFFLILCSLVFVLAIALRQPITSSLTILGFGLSKNLSLLCCYLL